MELSCSSDYLADAKVIKFSFLSYLILIPYVRNIVPKLISASLELPV
jgi:hypothetical protein